MADSPNSVEEFIQKNSVPKYGVVAYEFIADSVVFYGQFNDPDLASEEAKRHTFNFAAGHQFWSGFVYDWNGNIVFPEGRAC